MFGTLILIGALAIDGDTLRTDDYRIRLWGIDAPEMSEVQGPRSKAMLQRIVDQSGRLVCQVVDEDRYGRTVAQCYTEDLIDIGCLMVALGEAEEWVYYSRGYYRNCEGEGDD